MNEEKLYTINVINEFDLNEIKAIAFGCNDSEEITVVYKDDVRFDLIPYKDIKAINFVGKHLVIEKNEMEKFRLVDISKRHDTQDADGWR